MGKLKRNICIGCAIGVIVIVVGGIEIAQHTKRVKPNNSEIKTYLVKNLTSSGITPNDLKINNIKNENKSSFIVDFGFKTKENGFNKNYNDQVTYNYNKEWIPSAISIVNSTEIPSNELNENEAKSLIIKQGIDGITLNSDMLKLASKNVDLENSKNSFDFEYTYYSKLYSIKFTGTANFQFSNGKWGFVDYTNMKQQLALKPLSNEDIISTFINYEKTTDGSALGNTVTEAECSVLNSNINLENENGTAIVQVKQPTENGTATVRDYTVTLNFNSSINPGCYEWEVQNVKAAPTWNTVVIAPTAKILEYIAPQCNISGKPQTAFLIDQVQASNIQFDSANNTATATLTGTYTNFSENSAPKQGSFTGHFKFYNGGWQVTSIN